MHYSITLVKSSLTAMKEILNTDTVPSETEYIEYSITSLVRINSGYRYVYDRHRNVIH